MPSLLGDCLRELEPDPDVLLRHWCQAITDEELVAIASADYGYDADEHLAALRSIRRTASVPQPLDWEPKEVCSLVQWSGPKKFDGKQAGASADTQSVHRLCAFVSTVLITAQAHAGCQCDRNNHSAAALLASSLALGEPHVHLTRRLLASAAIAASDDPPEQVLIAFGALIAAVAEPVRLPGAILDRLAKAIITDVDRQHASNPGPSNQWMLGLTFYSIRHDMWVSLAKRLLVQTKRPHPPEADESLRLIGTMLAG